RFSWLADFPGKPRSRGVDVLAGITFPTRPGPTIVFDGTAVNTDEPCRCAPRSALTGGNCCAMVPPRLRGIPDFTEEKTQWPGIDGAWCLVCWRWCRRGGSVSWPRDGSRGTPRRPPPRPPAP